MKRILLLAFILLSAVRAYTQGCSNLVTNGDFSSGNTGFTTSYIYNPVSIVAEGTYAVVSQFNSVHSGFSGNDHTNPPTGLAMMINGSAVANTIVWQQTITGIIPNTTYYFSTWVNKQNGNPPPILQFSINGSQIGSNFSPTTTPNVWQLFFTSWFSGSNTTATIRLIDQVTAFGGNDFAIDDIFFTATAPLQIASATSTPASCAGSQDGSITITATGGVAPYQFSIDNGTTYVTASNPHTFTGLNPGSYTAILKDACGNVSNTQAVTVAAVDAIAPVVSGCPGTISASTGPGRTSCDQNVSWVAPTALDNCSAVTTSSTHNPGDLFPVGSTTVTYTFTDASNNSSTCVFSVVVTDDTPPVVSNCPGVVSVSTSPGRSTCDQNASWTAPTATDNCGAVTTSSTHNPGDLFPVGTTTVTYTFTDASNNSSTCTFSVNVADDTPPVINCPAGTVVGCDSSTAPSETGMATATDNCGTATVNYTDVTTAGNCAGNYTIARIWTATDAANNSSTCTQIIAVRDLTPPRAICRPVTLTLASGAATLSTVMVNNLSSDNCSGVSFLGLSRTSFDCSNIGDNNVTLTVRDACGNESACVAVVTVLGAIPTCSINVVPSNNTYTGGVPTDIYLGYGPQSATINVTATDGGPFTYSWSGPTSYLSCTNCPDPVFTPTMGGTYTYAVLVTNRFGCTTTCSVTFCVKDIRVPGNGNGKKVYICHVPPGNPNNPNTLSVSVNAVPSHLGNHSGDRLGACDQTCGSPVSRTIAGSFNVVGEDVKVYPNPNNGAFIVELPYLDESEARITVVDIQGKIVQQKTVRDGDGHKIRFELGAVARGMYMVEVAFADVRYRTKLTIQ